MEEAKRDYMICKSCYQRLDCDIVPLKDDWCVYFKKDQEIKRQEEKRQNMTDTIEMSEDEIKSLIEKLR
jgi:hypothetical protein